MICSRHEHRPRWTAGRRNVILCEAQRSLLRGQRVDMRGGYLRAIAAKVAEAKVVGDYDEEIGSRILPAAHFGYSTPHDTRQYVGELKEQNSRDAQHAGHKTKLDIWSNNFLFNQYEYGSRWSVQLLRHSSNSFPQPFLSKPRLATWKSGVWRNRLPQLSGSRKVQHTKAIRVYGDSVAIAASRREFWG